MGRIWPSGRQLNSPALEYIQYIWKYANTRSLLNSDNVVFPKQLSVGAAQGHSPYTPDSSKMNFYGCLENLLYNGLNMVELAKQNDQQVTAMVSSYL